MSLDWVLPFDALAASGGIDFDAPAFVLDKPARYVGHPDFETVLNMDNTTLLPEGTKIKSQPNVDGFGDENNSNIVKNPSWKKWAMGGILATAATAITVGVLAKKGKINLTKLKSLGDKVWNYVKMPFEWVAKKLKKQALPS